MTHAFTLAEIDRFRQWFDVVHDAALTRLQPEDYALVLKLYILCGKPISEFIVEGARRK